MNSMAMLEQVAAGKISPEEAAAAMMKAREEARRLPRPRWVPGWVWILAGSALGLVLAAFGMQRDRP